jgi:hypothetical protein
MLIYNRGSLVNGYQRPGWIEYSESRTYPIAQAFAESIAYN